MDERGRQLVDSFIFALTYDRIKHQATYTDIGQAAMEREDIIEDVPYIVVKDEPRSEPTEEEREQAIQEEAKELAETTTFGYDFWYQTILFRDAIDKFNVAFSNTKFAFEQISAQWVHDIKGWLADDKPTERNHWSVGLEQQRRRHNQQHRLNATRQRRR